MNLEKSIFNAFAANFNVDIVDWKNPRAVRDAATGCAIYMKGDIDSLINQVLN